MERVLGLCLLMVGALWKSCKNNKQCGASNHNAWNVHKSVKEYALFSPIANVWKQGLFYEIFYHLIFHNFVNVVQNSYFHTLLPWCDSRIHITYNLTSIKRQNICDYEALWVIQYCHLARKWCSNKHSWASIQTQFMYGYRPMCKC